MEFSARRSLVALLAALVLAYGSLGVSHGHAVDEGGEVCHSCFLCEVSAEDIAVATHPAAAPTSTDASTPLGRSAAWVLVERETPAAPRGPPAHRTL